MEESEKKPVETVEKEQEYTESLFGVIMLRKGRLEEHEVWFGTVGNQIVSDGAFGTKQELLDNLENITLCRICRIVAGAFERAINYKKEEE